MLITQSDKTDAEYVVPTIDKPCHLALGERINVRFHLNSEQRIGQVVSEYWRAPNADDIAMLRLTGAQSVEVKPVKLGNAIGSDRHTFRTVGYPNVGDYVGIAASGTIEAVTQKADGWRMIQLTSPQLAQGHSGAPVWVEVQHCVIGIVSEVYHACRDNKNSDTAFAVPTETLWLVCPELR